MNHIEVLMEHKYMRNNLTQRSCRSWWLMGLDPGYNIPELICPGGRGPVGLLGDEGFVKQGWDWGWCWLGKGKVE